MPTSFRQKAMTTLYAALGVAVFWYSGLPLPFLFGPMTACLLAALLGAQLRGLGQVSIGARTILGVAVGASITPGLVDQLPQMALSVALIPIYIAAIGLVGVPFFHRVCGFDRVTSYYSAMPGGLQDMVIFGIEAGGDARALSLIHATRVMIIVTAAPFLLTGLFGASLDNPIGVPASELPLPELMLMLFAALVGWKGGEKLGLFGASILGPIIVTAALSFGGVIQNRPPAEAILAAQYFIGMGIGVYYVGITLREIRRIVLAGSAFVLILAVLAAACVAIVTITGLAKPLEGILAFSPGGQAEMTVLAIIAGADLGFVVVHHVARMIVVITGAPIAARLFRMKENSSVPD